MSRRLMLSGSMIIRSTKSTVIQSTLYFSIDSRMSSAIMASESAAEVAGRRVQVSQKN